MLRRILVLYLTFALLFSGAAVPHSHVGLSGDDLVEHGRAPHLHIHALLAWFAGHHQHDADHEHDDDADHSKDQERIADRSGVATPYSMSSTKTSEHDDDAVYVVADPTAAERVQSAEQFKPILFVVIADVRRSLQRDPLRLCHDPPPPISIVPIYVRMLSLRI